MFGNKMRFLNLKLQIKIDCSLHESMKWNGFEVEIEIALEIKIVSIFVLLISSC